MFSNANPMMAWIAGMAEQVRENRRPAAEENPLLAMQEAVSGQIVAALDAWRDTTEALAERTFLAVYGSPMLQAAAGIDPNATRPLRKAGKSQLHHELLQRRIAELKAQIPVGGLREAIIRGLLYVGMARNAVDERGFEALRRIRRTQGELPLPAFKALVREQFNVLLIDAEAAVAAIPSMLPEDTETKRTAFALIEQILTARGEFSGEDRKRLQRVARLFGVEAGSAGRTPFRQTRTERQARAS
jgi:hypothetical protein